ncbi:unnamed protein product [Ilex paraguariensis]|uniref:Uncharacterized protein n=1 Tax=Ilex paraguariensis TaxID=185542 RepID=A0ABC8T8U2_9AQUA
MESNSIQHPIPLKPLDIQRNFASLFKKPSDLAKNGISGFDENSGKNLLSSANCVVNQSSMPPILPLVSQSIHFPHISQDPGISHRSSNPQISRSSSLPQINFLGQDSSGIRYPFTIQSSMVPQISLDSHLSVPQESSIANVPLTDSGNSSLGNGLLTLAGAPKSAKRVVYNNGEPGMYWTSEETLELSKGFSQTLIGKCAYGKHSLGVIREFIATKWLPKGENQRQVFQRKEIVHKSGIGNRFSPLVLEEQSHVVESGENLNELVARMGEKSYSREVEEEVPNVYGRENVEIQGGG